MVKCCNTCKWFDKYNVSQGYGKCLRPAQIKTTLIVPCYHRECPYYESEKAAK